jgi:putative phosphoribosyl transferase
MRFQDREHAGRLLAAKLEAFRSDRPIVLGLTSGGIPVAVEVARLLEAPLEMVVVRKLGAPGRSDLTLGAIAEGGETFVNPLILREAGLPEEAAARVAEDEVAELTRRVRLYRGGRPLPHVADRTVLVVDDGVATGASARAAGRAVRQRKARRVVLAAPVIASAVEPELRPDFDEVIALEVPARLGAIGDWYERFARVSDDDVLKYLRRAETELAAGLP